MCKPSGKTQKHKNRGSRGAQAFSVFFFFFSLPSYQCDGMFFLSILIFKKKKKKQEMDDQGKTPIITMVVIMCSATCKEESTFCSPVHSLGGSPG